MIQVINALPEQFCCAFTAQALGDAAAQHDVAGLSANARQDEFIRQVDVEQDGRYTGLAGGQSATKPKGSAREGGNPVERFARPVLLAESPDTIALTTPASALAFAGANLHLTAQGDAHLAAGHTWSAVSGRHAALFAQTGPVRVVAANGPVSLQAHTGALELLADQSVTVTATDERIDVLAKEKIVLQAGQTQITLEGGDITFACPGQFTVKASEHPFLGGASEAALLAKLPSGNVSAPDPTHWIALNYRDADLNGPMAGTEYEIHFAGGAKLAGRLDDDGKAHHDDLPDKRVEKVIYQPRPAETDEQPRPLEELLTGAGTQRTAP